LYSSEGKNIELNAYRRWQSKKQRGYRKPVFVKGRHWFDSIIIPGRRAVTTGRNRLRPGYKLFLKTAYLGKRYYIKFFGGDFYVV
jgi:hypothetical protein